MITFIYCSKGEGSVYILTRRMRAVLRSHQNLGLVSPGWIILGLSRKNCPPKNFYPRIKFFSNCIKKFLSYPEKFCPPGQAMSGSIFLGIFSVASYMLMFFLLFYMFYNLFHHTPRMISDSFLVTRWAIPGAMRIQSVTAATEQPDYHFH